MKSILCSALVLLVSVGAAQAAAQNQNQGQVLRLRQIAIYDNQGWGRPVVAYTMLVPVGWRVQGGIRWNARYRCLYSEMVTNQLRVTSPDGRYAFEMFPDYAAAWYQDPLMRQAQQRAIATGQKVCPLAQPFNAANFLTHIFLPGFRPGAQVVNIQQNPQAARALYTDTVNKLGPAMRQSNMQLSTDAARVLLRYKGSEEMVMATTSVTTTRGLSTTAAANGQMAYAMTYSSSATKVVSYRAPPGELRSKERLFSAMLSSIHINPAWENAVQQVILSIGNTVLKGTMDRANIMRNAQNQMGDMRMKTWEHQQATQDHVAHMWSQEIRDVWDYVDPSTNTKVELPSGYDNVWSNGNDEYLLTTIPGFNPNSDIKTNRTWTQMKAAR